MKLLTKIFSLFKKDNLSNDYAVRRGGQRFLLLVIVLFGLVFGIYRFVIFKHVTTDENMVNFDQVISADFSNVDARSALLSQQNDVDQHSKKLETLEKQLQENRQTIVGQEVIIRQMQEDLQKKSPVNVEQLCPMSTGSDLATEIPMPEEKQRMPMIQGFNFVWADQETDYKTVNNYVPAGSFVTAILVGGAAANAGIDGQGDTVPVLFRTINQGFLPNGYHSRLKNCTVTGSTWGEISSSRGIVRTNRLSCVLADESILDIPVEGTVFNFGRNGIRGTAIMRNRKIIEMAGVSGFFTGMGQTAQNLSSMVTSSAGGTTSTVLPNRALLNMGGATGGEVGSQLAKYYIDLAKMYHPVIELNPGTRVNIVFLKGFYLNDKQAQSDLTEKPLDKEYQWVTH